MPRQQLHPRVRVTPSTLVRRTRSGPAAFEPHFMIHVGRKQGGDPFRPPECITDVDRRRVRLLGSQSASGSSRERPAASISSTNGVGAKKPRPSDALIVQGPAVKRGKARAEM
jgi:hypothetical protein